MRTASDIVAIVCSNGLGHFHRVLSVLQSLTALRRDLTISLICERWQKARFEGSRTLSDLESSAAIRWHHGIMNPGVQWSSDLNHYSGDRLFSWADRLGDIPDVGDARLGLSDNLAGVLQLRPDAVLMGSFLWSDVLEKAYSQNFNVRSFVEWERGLLDRFRPSLLCVGQMVMPAAAQRTRAVPLPWMRSGTRPDRTHRGNWDRRELRVAILIGSTGVLHGLAVAATDYLLSHGAQAALPPDLYSEYQSRSGVVPFEFSEADFLDCDVALCRPGMGAIQDCTFHGLPMVLIDEPQNPEMVHNALRAEALGLGCYLRGHCTGEAIAEHLISFAASSSVNQVEKKMMQTEMGGDLGAAEWLLEKLA